MNRLPFKIHLASILLEPSRWMSGRVPSLRVSEWSERAARAGFEGWELFESHYVLASEAERSALQSGPLAVRVFNSYAVFDDAGESERANACAAARALRVGAMKFNVGNMPAHAAEYRRAIAASAATLGDDARLWCECHSGTLFEQPERLVDFGAHGREWPFDVIIHPFLLGPEEIVRWGRLLGPRIRHAHVQMRAREDSRRFLQLADDAARARECLAALREAGFAGSFSLEFAAPTGRRDDEPESLFAAACRDLEFLRQEWTG